MDLRRLKEQAAKLSADGRYERSEVLYRQLLTHAPRDSGLWLKHADVLKRLSRPEAAVPSYRMAAQLLMEHGHANRAIACLKIALGLLPNDVELVSDIIRYELRVRQKSREVPAVEMPVRPEPADDAAPEERLLALPMFVASDSRISSFVESSGNSEEGIPAPRASVPRIPLELEVPHQRWPQIRRVSDGEIAIKPSPFAHWIVVTSKEVIDVRFFEEFPVAEEAVWLEEPSS